MSINVCFFCKICLQKMILSPSVLLYKMSQVIINFFRAMLIAVRWPLPVIPSHSIVEYGWGDEVTEMLSAGARISQQDADGNTAVHVAFLKYGKGPVVESLINKYLQETQRNIVNKDGLSIVHVACTCENVEHLQKLLRKGRVDVNHKVSRKRSAKKLQYAGYTCLHFAVAFGQYDIADLLLTQHGANLYKQDINESTPLHLALENRNIEMMDLLLAYDTRRKNNYNKYNLSHFMVACAGSNETAFKEYLDTSKAPPISLFYRSVVGGKFNGYLPQHFALTFRRYNRIPLLRIGKATAVESYHWEDESESSSESSMSDYESIESLIFNDGNSNKCVEYFCIGLKVLAFAMFSLIIVPSLFRKF